MSAERRIRRVVVTGPEAAGKSTLAQRLAIHLRVPAGAEYARTYAERVQRTLTAADVEPIARGQIAVEAAAEQRARASGAQLIVLDTDLVSTVVYATHYYGECPDWIVRTARERRGDLYLLLRPDLPWTPDGIRDRPHLRAEMHDAFRDRLVRFDARFTEISGAAAERLPHALRAIEEALAPDPSGGHQPPSQS